jgi:NADH-quinone oxidoreductase subunit B
MGANNPLQKLADLANNPIPDGRLDDILRPDSLLGTEGNPLLEQGFVTTSFDVLWNWARTGSMWPMTFGLACCAAPHAWTWTAMAWCFARRRASPTS